jgi:hypothetical protein
MIFNGKRIALEQLPEGIIRILFNCGEAVGGDRFQDNPQVHSPPQSTIHSLIGRVARHVAVSCQTYSVPETSQAKVA